MNFTIFTDEEVEKLLIMLPPDWEQVVRFRYGLWPDMPEMLSIGQVSSETGKSPAAVAYRLKGLAAKIRHVLERRDWFADLEKKWEAEAKRDAYLLRHPEEIPITYMEKIGTTYVLPQYYGHQILALGARTLGELATFSPQKLESHGMTKKGVRAVVKMLRDFKVPYPFRPDPIDAEEIVDRWQEVFS